MQSQRSASSIHPTSGISLSLWIALALASLLMVVPHSFLAAQTGTASTSADAYIASGIALYRAHNAAAARLQFSAGVRADPHSADAFTWRGIAENQLKQYTEAVRDFQAALRINADEMSAHYNLGLSFIRLGKLDAAIEQLQIVVKSHPGVVEPEYNLALLFEEKKATAQAVDHLQAAYPSQPNDIGIEQHLLVDLMLLGRVSEAQPLLQALQAGASDQAQQQVATALLEAGQFQPAVLLLEGIRARATPDRKLDLLLARAYIGASGYEQAIALLNGMAGDATGETSYLLGLAQSGAGNAAEARAAFQDAVHANPRNAPALYHLGLMELAAPGAQANALRYLREAVRLEPGNEAYALMLVRVLLQQDKAAEALAALQHVHPEGPAAGERDLLLGIAMISTTGAQQALPVLKRAVAESPNPALSHNILGFCFFQQGDYAEAAASYGKASELNPAVLIFAHDAAVAFERANDIDQATIYAKRAVALPTANGDDHYLMAKLLVQSARKEDAIAELKKAIQLSPDLDESYYLLARTYMQAGDAAQAAEWNTKFTELKQKHAQAEAANKKAVSIPSSTLLQGAPMSSEEKREP